MPATRTIRRSSQSTLAHPVTSDKKPTRLDVVRAIHTATMWRDYLGHCGDPRDAESVIEKIRKELETAGLELEAIGLTEAALLRFIPAAA